MFICMIINFLVPSATPDNVRTGVLSSTSIRVTWDAPDMTHWNGILLFYSLTYYGVGLDGVIRVVNYTISGSNHTNETYLFSGLQEYTEYEFLVAAHTSVGRGHAASVSARTLESGISLLM